MSSEYTYESKSYDMSCTTIWQLLNTHLIVLYSLGFILISIELVNRYLMQCNTIVRVVRTIRRLFGSDSSKSTKFAPEVDNAIRFTFLPGAKLSDIYTNKEFIKFQTLVPHPRFTVHIRPQTAVVLPICSIDTCMHIISLYRSITNHTNLVYKKCSKETE